jgi:putative oxidoreductase
LSRFDDLGKLLLRIAVGGLMLFHGISKLQHGIPGIQKRVLENGLPGWVAPGVYIGEIIAPVLLLLGLFTRPAAIVVAINMLFAIGLSHRADVFKLSERGGAWAIELPAFYLIAAIAVACLGSGKYTVSGREN